MSVDTYFVWYVLVYDKLEYIKVIYFLVFLSVIFCDYNAAVFCWKCATHVTTGVTWNSLRYKNLDKISFDNSGRRCIYALFDLNLANPREYYVNPQQRRNFLRDSYLLL